MDSQELANILRRMYSEAGDGEQVVMIHLFGVRYAAEIRACEDSPARIAKKARISERYGTEINKGCNLARYVEVKNSVSFPSGKP